MKHLKTYEHKTKYKTSQFSEYLIWSTLENTVRIFKNDHKIDYWQKDKNQPVLRITHLYTYDLQTKELTKVTGQSNERTTGVFLAEDTLPRILFQSDNLQDCINTLPILSATNKYNL